MTVAVSPVAATSMESYALATPNSGIYTDFSNKPSAANLLQAIHWDMWLFLGLFWPSLGGMLLFLELFCDRVRILSG